MIFVSVKTEVEIKKTLSKANPPNSLNLEYFLELIKSNRKPRIVEKIDDAIIPSIPNLYLIEISTNIK